MKKRITFVLLSAIFALLFTDAVLAQIHSVVFNSGWSSALSPGFSLSKEVRKDIKVNSAAGFGGGIDIRFTAAENFLVSVSANYQYYAINQDSALGRWGWKFWETRYKNNVRDMLSTDTLLKAQLTPRETMDSYPIFINCSYTFHQSGPLQFSAHAGAGVIFYYRKFMLEETWSKYYPTVGYTFLYSFRDFAPAKVGNPLALQLGAECTYRLTEIFGINSSVQYLQIINTGSKLGADNFPFRRALQAKLGLTIYY